MKKILFAAVAVLAIGLVIGYISSLPPKHRMTEEITVNYNKTDSEYIKHGTFKKVFRKYNYKYTDSAFHWVRNIDYLHYISCFLNEYQDTVCLIYTDCSNYPNHEGTWMLHDIIKDNGTK